jgi:hypothetical protein
VTARIVTYEGRRFAGEWLTPEQRRLMVQRALSRRHRRKGSKGSHARMLAQHRDLFGEWCPGAAERSHEPHQVAKPNRLTVDHIVPPTKGGTNSYANKRILCEAENGDKADEIPADIMAARETTPGRLLALWLAGVLDLTP